MWRPPPSDNPPAVLVGEFTITDNNGRVLQTELLYLRVPKNRDIFADLTLFAYLQECAIISEEIYQGLLSERYLFDGNLDVKVLPMPDELSAPLDDMTASTPHKLFH